MTIIFQREHFLFLSFSFYNQFLYIKKIDLDHNGLVIQKLTKILLLMKYNIYLIKPENEIDKIMKKNIKIKTHISMITCINTLIK